MITLQSNYEGQIQTLLGYIESSTDALVVAGGGGTIMEVSRLQDKEKWITMFLISNTCMQACMQAVQYLLKVVKFVLRKVKYSY